LVEVGADKDQAQNQGATPLFIAASHFLVWTISNVRGTHMFNKKNEAEIDGFNWVFEVPKFEQHNIITSMWNLMDISPWRIQRGYFTNFTMQIDPQRWELWLHKHGDWIIKQQGEKRWTISGALPNHRSSSSTSSSTSPFFKGRGGLPTP
jgi:hypothetical protein